MSTNKVKLPKQIKIGPYLFDVNSRDQTWRKVNECYGRVHTGLLQMDIVTDMDHTIVLDTIIHEIYHAIWYIFNIEADEGEERCITPLATGFTTVLIDNPELVKLINKVTKEQNA